MGGTVRAIALTARSLEFKQARMKDTLKAGDEWFRAAADASLDSLFVAKGVRDEAGQLVDFECIDVNGTALAMLGIAREKVIGQKLWGLLPINRETFFDKYAQVLATGSPLEEEFPVDTPETKAKWLRHQVVRVGDGIAISARDVTRWKESGARLKESEERLRLATEAAHIGAWTWDPKIDRFSFSEGIGPVFGLPRGEGFHTPEEMIKAVYPADRDIVARALLQGREKGTSARVEVRTLWPDGTLHWVESESNFICDATGAVERGVGIAMDITERKHTEEALRESRDLLGSIVENAPIRVFWKDLELRYLGCNSLFARDAGMSRPDELVGKDDFQMGWRKQAERYRADDRRVVDSNTPTIGYEEPQTTPDGHEIWLRSSKVPLHDANGKVVGMLGIYDDITERKLAEESRLQVQVELLEAQRIAHVGSWQLEVATGHVTWSKELYLMFGLNPAAPATDYAGQPRLFAPESWERLSNAVSHTQETGSPYELELETIRADGVHGWMLARGEAIRDEGGTVVKLRGVAMDVTERKAGELALTRANRALRTLSACNAALISAVSEPELLDTICRLIVDAGGYSMAWVGFAEQSPKKQVRVVAQYGSTDEYLQSMNITWSDTEHGRGPTGRAIQSRTTQVHQSLMDESDKALWRDAALAHGFQSSISLPLKQLSGATGALTLYARERDVFTEEEVHLLEELANDLAFGIATLRTRAERDRMAEAHQHHEEILRKSLEESIQAISDTVEMRDPYTTGHQKRVAQLAVAIATDLTLPKDEIHGIHLAAGIHDLGKIRVPSEILSKPGKLTDIEYQLIKAHAQAGYDILKGIEFPWPLANIVLQHHERLDGSGYPQGLKGEQILLGARIIAVADVVEAMASHRPYRAALGTDLALAEIERGRGTAYDPAVADACLKLFREGRFAFQG
jgi:PAS domain S-box-containing protein